ncbi:MAG: 50S ribosomal protein L10 [Candidatus Omnitrophota bacterium]
MSIVADKKVGKLFRETMAGLIKEGLEKRSSTFVVNYSRVSSSKMDDFRKNLHRVGADLYVSRNSIARRALKELKFDTLADKLDGQTAFIWSDADSVEVSKALVKFSKSCEGILLRGGLLEGKMLGQDDVKRLSDLPSRIVLLTMVASTLQAPLNRLAGALTGKTRDLLYLLKQISEQKGGK